VRFRSRLAVDSAASPGRCEEGRIPAPFEVGDVLLSSARRGGGKEGRSLSKALPRTAEGGGGKGGEIEFPIPFTWSYGFLFLFSREGVGHSPLPNLAESINLPILYT